MSAFSDYLETELGNLTLRGGTYTSGPVYMALFTSDPTDADTGGELTDSGYSRLVAHASAVSDGFIAEGNGVFKNGNPISFPAIQDAEVSITHWALFTAATGGNMLYHAALTTPKTLDVDDVLNFPVGSVSVTLS